MFLCFKVEESLAALDRAVAAAKDNNYEAAISAAQMARTSAEAAFSNPAVLAQLSFPQSHLVGVYVPLFLPVGMSLLQALFLELRQRYKRKK